LEDVADPDESEPTPKATSTCCPKATFWKRENTKRLAIKVSFFKFLSKGFLDIWM
jgi:hypothetical protein